MFTSYSRSARGRFAVLPADGSMPKHIDEPVPPRRRMTVLLVGRIGSAFTSWILATRTCR